MWSFLFLYVLPFEVIAFIESNLQESILDIQPVSGGDISSAYRLTTENRTFFLKSNSGLEAYKMFEAEKLGLEAIASTKTVKTPKVYFCYQFDGLSVILMEHIRTKPASSSDMELLGQQLAQLHQSTASHFGLTTNNFIGSLPQSNALHESWNNFYIEERLKPQLKLARRAGLLNEDEIPEDSRVYESCDMLFKDVKPSLLHGDLWSGNYLISENGKPNLIDPAVYYGHSEVDIAMSKLFGGFAEPFYRSYHEVIPKTKGFDARIDLYQLYYLLVHLNLFGRSYYGSVKRILSTYF